MADFNKILMTGDGSASIPGTFTAKGGLSTSGPLTAENFVATPNALAYSSAITVPAENGVQTLQCVHATSATATLTPSGPGTAGQTIEIIVYGDAASGSCTLTFASTFRPSATLVQTATTVSILTFLSDGVNWIEQSRVSNTT